MEQYTPMTVCPHCGARIREDSPVCDYCDCSLPRTDYTNNNDNFGNAFNGAPPQQGGYNTGDRVNPQGNPSFSQGTGASGTYFGGNTGARSYGNGTNQSNQGSFINPNEYNTVPQGKKINKWFSFFLCFFLGYLGAHKFYEGKTTMGIIYLLTGGLCGFGWILDIIIIFFKPDPYYI